MKKIRLKWYKKFLYFLASLAVVYLFLFILLPWLLGVIYGFGQRDLSSFTCDKNTGNILSDSWCEIRIVYVWYATNTYRLDVRSIAQKIDGHIASLSGGASQVDTRLYEALQISDKQPVTYERNENGVFVPKKTPE